MFDSKKQGAVTDVERTKEGRVTMVSTGRTDTKSQWTMIFSFTSHHLFMIKFICMTGAETQKSQGRRFTEEKDKFHGTPGS